MPGFPVDIWDGPKQLTIIETMATATNALVARAAFDEACRQRPRDTITLRQGIMVMATFNGPCRICDGVGWVCENHPDKPFKGLSGRLDACSCGAGMPCTCNESAERPETPPGFTVVIDENGPRN